MLEIGTKVLIGFVIGTLIGMTGLGGGVLLLPTLIFGLGVPPIVAVGSDMLCNFITKLGAGFLHWRDGSVIWPLVGSLCAGSIPGVFAGVSVLAHLRNVYGNGVNEILKTMVGIILLIVPILLLLRGQLQRDVAMREPWPNGIPLGVVVIGALTGLLVGMTSVGSGSILMMLLLLFYGFAPRAMVGSDIVHAVVLTGTGSLLHSRLGTIDTKLVFGLVLGAVPGGLIGARLSQYVPAHWLRRVLCGMLVATGARMLWA